jgi:hypothetical protein
VTANGYTGNPPGSGGGGGSTAWADITGKPSTFPPSAHTQAASTISDSTTVGRAVLTAADAAAGRTAIGAEASGAASTAVAAHVAAADPHPTYLTAAEGNAAYAALIHTHTIANVTNLQSTLDGKADDADVAALDTRLDTLELSSPVVMSWNGSAYVADADARVYVGPGDPGAVADGSIWIDTTP